MERLLIGAASPSRAPLVQVSVTQEKAHRPQQLGAWRFFLPQSGAKLTMGGLQIEQYYIEQRSSQCDLEMAFEEGDGTVEGMLRFNEDLFETETVRRMVGHFLRVLEGIADNPDRRLSELPWLTDAERPAGAPRLERAAKADFPQGLCLHRLFEGQAARISRRDCADRRRAPAGPTPSWISVVEPATRQHRLHGQKGSRARDAGRIVLPAARLLEG